MTKRFSSFKRDITTNTVEELDSILIICEGIKTEPNYFDRFDVYGINVKVLGVGKNTESLVREALDHKKDYDIIWCVFDKDSFTERQFNSACQLAKDNGIEVAYSNESFELWYILHFNYLDTQIGRTKYIEKLNEIFIKEFGIPYKKNNKDTYKILKEYQSIAIKNAKKLDNQHGIYKTPSQKSPVTYVYKLVEYLNNNSRSSRW